MLLVNCVRSSSFLLTLLHLTNAATTAPSAEPCQDIGTDPSSKYTCLDYGCLNLCHLGHVKKLCHKTCGVCGDETVGLPSVPAVPMLAHRTETVADMQWSSPATPCPIKQIEYRLTPSVKGGKTNFLFTVKDGEPSTSTIRGLLSDISYVATLRVKSSFGWSESSPELTIAKVGWTNPDPSTSASSSTSAAATATIATPITTTATTTAAPSVPPPPAPPSKLSQQLSPPPPLPPSPRISPRPLPRKRAPATEESHKKKKRRLIQRAQKEVDNHHKEIRIRRREQEKRDQQEERSEL